MVPFVVAGRGDAYDEDRKPFVRPMLREDAFLAEANCF
jgi:hypothetical protein